MTIDIGLKTINKSRIVDNRCKSEINVLQKPLLSIVY